MEQLLLLLAAGVIAFLTFLWSFKLYKNSHIKSLIPLSILALLTVAIMIIANIIDGWTGVFIAIGGLVVGVAAILHGVTLLMYHLHQKK